MIQKTDHQLKVVLVGDTAVGKSCILKRFVDDEFEEGLLSTIGVDFRFRKLKIDNKENVKLQIWDTAGQETFRAIVSAYYNSADAIIIVYDMTSQKSFENVREYWIKEAQNSIKQDAIIVLIANKKDQESLRSVDKELVKQFMEMHNIKFHYEVSAKTGQNIQDTFFDITRNILSKNPNSLHSHHKVRLQSLYSSQRDQQQARQKSRCCLK